MFSGLLLAVTLIDWQFPFRACLPSDESYFRPVVTQYEQEQFMHLLSMFQRAAESANVTYMITGGTLIGALRHHGMIPWDDDVDVYIDGSMADRLETSLSNLGSEYQLHKNTFPSFYWEQKLWKFCFANRGRPVSRNDFRWPYIDIHLYETNSTHIYSLKWAQSFDKRQIFPLRRVPFGLTVFDRPLKSIAPGHLLWLPAPCEIPSGYFQDICINRQFSHFGELPLSIGSQYAIDCNQLKARYPFVKRIQRGIVNATDGKKVHPRYSTTFEAIEINHVEMYRVEIRSPVCDGTVTAWKG